MNAVILIGKEKSMGVPGKNVLELVGRPVVEYPLMAAKYATAVDRIYVSTDSPRIKELGRHYGAEIIDRPAELARPESPTEDVFAHAYRHIVDTGETPDYLFLTFANSVDILPAYWDRAVEMLEAHPDFDSAISISKYNMFTPLRSRRLNADGTTEPTLDLDALGIENTFDRDAMGDCYFVDFGVQVVRPRCLEKVDQGAAPFKWLGRKQGAIVKDFGFDIDAPWQVPVLEYWLREHGFTEDRTPYDTECS